MTATALTVEAVTERAAFEALGPSWDGLLAASRADTPFLAHDWASAWWEAYGAGRELFVLLVRREGALVGVAPLCRRRRRDYGLLESTEVAFLGDGTYDSDYLDVIAARGQEAAVAERVLAYLGDRPEAWDVLRLNEVPEVSPTVEVVRRVLGRSGVLQDEREVPCAVLELPGDWESYLKRLKPRMRTKVRSLTARLEATGQVQVDRVREAGDIAPRLASLFALHEARWRTRGQGGVFVTPEKRRFYEAVAARLLERDALRFYSLSVAGAFVAHQFCFEWGRRVFLLQEGFDPAREEEGVGNVLRAHVMRDCIERGVTTYDFLGGVTSHKLSWGAEVKRSLRFTAGRATAKNRILFGVPRGIEAGKAALKAVLPGPVLALARSLRDGRAARPAAPAEAREAAR